MVAAEPSSETPVLEWMIEVKAGIITAAVVSDPPSVCVSVRCMWMPRLVAIVSGSPSMMSSATISSTVGLAAAAHRSRPLTGNVPTTDARRAAAMHAAATGAAATHAAATMAAAAALCVGGNRTRQRKSEESDYVCHTPPSSLGHSVTRHEARLPANSLGRHTSRNVPE